MIKQRIPNYLTLSRSLLGVFIALLGFRGQGQAGVVLLLLILGWTGDMMDGRLARYYHKEPGFIGDYEILFDLIMCLGALAYLSIAGILPLAVAEIYISFTAGILIIVFLWEAREGFSLEGFKWFRKVAWAMELPLVFIPPVFCIFYSPLWIAVLFGIWMGVMLIWDWRRAMEQKDEIVTTYLRPIGRKIRALLK